MAETFEFGGRQVDVIDLSQNLSNATSEFEPVAHEIRYEDHTDSLALVERWGLGADHWRDGLVWANYHYHPTSEGRPARTIDDVPFRWVMGDGVVLDVSTCDRVEGIHEADVRSALEAIEYELKPYDIVLLRTDVSRRFSESGYEQLHPGLRRDACAWLVERGVKLIGIDAWGIDRPFGLMVEDVRRGDVAQLWESHKYGADREYSQIEKLLTKRELEVIEHVIKGRTNGDIARALVVSEETIKFHVKNILRKLGASNRGRQSRAS